jgi:D-glycero-alpha-D-manno-heptose-7-phosphate kinase
MIHSLPSASRQHVSIHLTTDIVRNDNLHSFGQVLHDAWMLKREMAPGVSTPEIDEWYDTARNHGAVGGKILGAGAGGFLALFAPEDRHEAIRHALPKLRAISVDFERTGSQIIFFLSAEFKQLARRWPRT